MALNPSGSASASIAFLRCSGRGMTLIELLVVLAILALLTTAAVTSSDVFMGQGRYDATSRTLSDIQEAVLGPANAFQPGGNIITSGFVADMGRLPNCTSTDTTVGLSELWIQPAGGSFTISPASDSEVLVPCGWRGPYLRLPVGESSLRDGWGQSDGLARFLSRGQPGWRQ